MQGIKGINWRRLFFEVRPSFVPYARSKVRTRFSTEQCRERLERVTQPQKTPALFSAPTSQDTRYLFKGQVSKTGFLAMPIDQKPMRQRRRETKPFLVVGHFKPTFGGTDIIVQVFPDPLGLLLVFGMFCFYLVQFLAFCLYPVSDKLVFVPISFGLLLFAYAALVLPVSFEAFQSKKTLQRLFEQAASD